MFLSLVFSVFEPLSTLRPSATNQAVGRRICVTLIRGHGARGVCRRFAYAAIEQFVQVGLLPECDPRQNNAGESYKLNDESKRLIASNGRVKIEPERGRADQVNDSNCIA